MGLNKENIGCFGKIPHPDGTETRFFPGYPLAKGEVGEYAKTILSETTAANVYLKDAPRTMYPFAGDITSVVGWGGGSMAVRLQDKLDENNSHIIVIKPLNDVQKLPREDDPHLYQAEKNLIQSRFKNFLVPSECVLSRGPDGNPFLLKVSKEVPGFTLAEIPLPSLLSDIHLLNELADFYTTVIAHYEETGILIDLWGVNTKDLFSKLKVLSAPFFLKNLMVTSGKRELKLVDVSMNRDFTHFDSLSPLRKFRMLSQVQSIKATKFLLDLVPTESSWINWKKRLVKPMLASQEKDFHSSLGRTIDVLSNKKIDYRVVGSLAAASWMDQAEKQSFDPRKLNGSLSDVDVLCFTDVSHTKALQQEIDTINHAYPNSLPVSLRAFPGEDAYFFMRQIMMASNKVDANGQKYLAIGDLKLPLSESDLAPVERELWGTRFVTLRPEILAGLYFARVGHTKSKDARKMRDLCTANNCEVPIKFIDFGRKVMHTYPLSRKFGTWIEFGDLVTGGFLLRTAHELKKWSGMKK